MKIVTLTILISIFPLLLLAQNWVDISPNNNHSYSSILVINKDSIFVTSYDGFIYSSFDGGNSWTGYDLEHQATWSGSIGPYPTYIGCIHFVESIGYAAGQDGDFFKTYDFGNNWEYKGRMPAFNPDLTDIYFVTDSIGFALHEGGLFFKTENGGDTWSLSILPDEFEKFHVFSEDTIVTVGEGIYKTVSGGMSTNNWVAQHQSGAQYYNAVYMHNQNSGIVVGEGGYISRSFMGIWSVPEQITNYHLYDVDFKNDSVGVVAGGTWNGSESIVATTYDGGTNWLFDTLLNANLKDIAFINDSTILAVGLYGSFFINHNFSSIGVEQNIKEKPFSIYPNPATQFLFLSVPTEEQLEVNIYDIAGRKIMKLDTVSGVIDISTLPEGQYLVQILTEVAVLHRFFIKQ